MCLSIHELSLKSCFDFPVVLILFNQFCFFTVRAYLLADLIFELNLKTNLLINQVFFVNLKFNLLYGLLLIEYFKFFLLIKFCHIALSRWLFFFIISNLYRFDLLFYLYVIFYFLAAYIYKSIVSILGLFLGGEVACNNIGPQLIGSLGVVLL